MKRIYYVLAFALFMASIPAPAQTWEIGGNGRAAQTQNGNKQSTGPQATQESSKHKASVSDDDLKLQVNRRFGTDAALRNVLVDVQNRVVVLSGTVPTRADRKRADHLAKSVAGVRRVRDFLEVDANATSTGSNEPANARSTTRARGNATVARRRKITHGAGPDVAAKERNSNSGQTAIGAQTPGTSPASTQAGAVSGNSGGISGVAASTAASQGGSSASTNGSIASRSSGSSLPAASGANAKGLSSSETPSTIPGMHPEVNTDTLKGQIENAIHNDPTMAGANVEVNVASDAIELSGNVPSGKQKTTAWRIAESYAFNKRVQDKIVVTRPANSRGNSASGQSSPATSTMPSSNNSGQPR